MSDPLGQRRDESKGSATASRSLLKGFSWEDVRSLAQERLVIRLTSAKRMGADSLGVEVDFATDQAVGPEGIGLERAIEQTGQLQSRLVSRGAYRLYSTQCHDYAGQR